MFRPTKHSGTTSTKLVFSSIVGNIRQESSKIQCLLMDYTNLSRFRLCVPPILLLVGCGADCSLTWLEHRLEHGWHQVTGVWSRPDRDRSLEAPCSWETKVHLRSSFCIDSWLAFSMSNLSPLYLKPLRLRYEMWMRPKKPSGEKPCREVHRCNVATAVQPNASDFSGWRCRADCG